jgi:transposase InsO family protein
LQIKHLRSRPYRPQTNGKAERFIRTLIAGWAHGAIYRSSNERTAALDGWLWHYGWKSSRWTGGGSFARVGVGAGDRELKRRRWGCFLPRCLAD